MKWLDRNATMTLAELPKLGVKAMDTGGMVWRTKEGKLVTIGEMADSHLANCIRLMERRAAESKLSLCLRQSVHTVAKTMFPIYAVMVMEMRKRLVAAEKNRPAQLVLERPSRRFRLK